MEEKIQEMLDKINEKYNDFEIRITDFSLLRKLENVIDKVATRTFLGNLYFKYLFAFVINENLFVVSQLYLNFNKYKEKFEYEVGNVYEPMGTLPNHELHFKLEVSRFPSNIPFIGEKIANAEDILKRVIWEEKLPHSYLDCYNRFVFPLNAEVIHYTVL